VYRMLPKQNPMYKYRESIPLGPTPLCKEEVKEALLHLQQDWQGESYDLLTRNCCHFCDAFCKLLRVKPAPCWLNRFAFGADATVTFTNRVYCWVRAHGCACRALMAIALFLAVMDLNAHIASACSLRCRPSQRNGWGFPIVHGEASKLHGFARRLGQRTRSAQRHLRVC
jgi:PPPDE putative peptidase domain